METNYLLDTQIALWLLLDDPRLRPETRDLLQNAEGALIFHQTSSWEIEIKYGLNKLPLPEAPGSFLLQAVSESGLTYRCIEDEAIFFLNKLPPIHRDPFDRLLVCHAAINSWVMLTADKTLISYPVRSVYCG